MENRIEAVENKINELIKIAVKRFNGNWDDAHELRIAKIEGMIQALSILTGKDYYYNETGVHEM